jgi:hypothetical protein
MTFLNRSDGFSFQMIIMIMSDNNIINIWQFLSFDWSFIISRNSKRDWGGIFKNGIKNNSFAIEFKNCRRMSKLIQCKIRWSFGKAAFIKHNFGQLS